MSEYIKIGGIVIAAVVTVHRLYFIFKDLQEHRKSSTFDTKQKILENGLKEVFVGNRYKVCLPPTMQETLELNDEALLQYKDEENDIYIIGIDETAVEFMEIHKEYGTYDNTQTLLENYKTIQLRSFTEEMEVFSKYDEREIHCMDISSMITDFEARVKGIPFPIYYVILFVEAHQYLYMLITWTSANKRSKNEQQINKILHSFDIVKQREFNPIQTR